MLSLIARFMGPTWGPSGADRTQVGPMLAPWTLLSVLLSTVIHINCRRLKDWTDNGIPQDPKALITYPCHTVKQDSHYIFIYTQEAGRCCAWIYWYYNLIGRTIIKRPLPVVLIYDTRKQVDMQKSTTRLRNELSLIMFEYDVIWFILKSLTLFCADLWILWIICALFWCRCSNINNG